MATMPYLLHRATEASYRLPYTIESLPYTIESLPYTCYRLP
jgi:hypothetical protein